MRYQALTAVQLLDNVETDVLEREIARRSTVADAVAALRDGRNELTYMYSFGVLIVLKGDQVLFYMPVTADEERQLMRAEQAAAGDYNAAEVYAEAVNARGDWAE